MTIIVPVHGPSVTSYPSNAGNGRDTHGRFAPGNKGGPGNPHAGKVAILRRALLDAVTTKDVQEVARALLRKARSGDVAAVKVLLPYLLGPPATAQDAELEARLERLEATLAR